MSVIKRQCQVQVTDPVQVSEDESDGWEDDESDCEWLYDQELQIDSSAFTELMKSAGNSEYFRYCRGPEPSRQTLWREKNRIKSLAQAATGTAKIKQFFEPRSNDSSELKLEIATPVLSTVEATKVCLENVYSKSAEI